MTNYVGGANGASIREAVPSQDDDEDAWSRRPSLLVYHLLVLPGSLLYLHDLLHHIRLHYS